MSRSEKLTERRSVRACPRALSRSRSRSLSRGARARRSDRVGKDLAGEAAQRSAAEQISRWMGSDRSSAPGQCEGRWSARGGSSAAGGSSAGGVVRCLEIARRWARRDRGLSQGRRRLPAALASRSSLAAQLGLKVKRVAIDPGHGGRDRGATGPHGIREKDVALAIAKRVATQLRALGFAVVMTRKEDRFVSLDDRTRIANEARADLFVSIHCNASRRRRLAGAETWTLNVGSDRY